MNWKEIKYKYPFAFQALCDSHKTVEAWGEIDNPEIWDIFIKEPHWVMRHLYDFFDEQGIWVELGLQYDDNEICRSWTVFVIEKGKKRKPSDDIGSLWPRKDAEEYGFTHAFEILENKLK